MTNTFCNLKQIHFFQFHKITVYKYICQCKTNTFVNIRQTHLSIQPNTVCNLRRIHFTIWDKYISQFDTNTFYNLRHIFFQFETDTFLQIETNTFLQIETIFSQFETNTFLQFETIWDEYIGCQSWVTRLTRHIIPMYWIQDRWWQSWGMANLQFRYVSQ